MEFVPDDLTYSLTELEPDMQVNLPEWVWEMFMRLCLQSQEGGNFERKEGRTSAVKKKKKKVHSDGQRAWQQPGRDA